ncbi:MAG: glutamate--tRNA ligase [Bacteroidetes bacterium]|nr:glutamate--tRNA ligase [Bacteroidota bacterium]
MERKVRVRFAPSPTGPLHIGGVRTALYNYLFAKQKGGTMILRIEDTDQGRFVPGAEEYIIDSLTWLGIKFDEGVHVGGPYGPYRQSDRKPLYREYADKLISKGWAYYAFDTPDSLEEIRKSYEAEKKAFQYDVTTRNSLRNSLTLSHEEAQQLIADNHPYVIRFKMPENQDIVVNDHIRGRVVVHSGLLDDKVLFKSDGMPTYHLANIVDDHLMEISHVIRGEEWLPSAPLHVMLYRAFGWEDTMPEFAHLPLLLKPDGNGKLSKRDGDRLGFPVFPTQWQDPKTGEISSGYRESGYFAEAVINILAFLGWNPGTTQEMFSMDELIHAFSIERISKSGAKFDVEKAKWFNQQYVRQHSGVELAKLFMPELKGKGISIDEAKLAIICDLVKERVSFIKELWDQSYFFFKAPDTYDEQVIKKRWKEDTALHLQQIALILENTSPFETQPAHDNVVTYIQENALNMGQIMNCLRLVIVGAAIGPDLFTIINSIGKAEAVKRINKGVDEIKLLT